MTDKNRLLSNRSLDQEPDYAFRPSCLNEFIGQDALKANLNIYIQAAKKKKVPTATLR